MVNSAGLRAVLRLNTGLAPDSRPTVLFVIPTKPESRIFNMKLDAGLRRHDGLD
jgi:hypothetical protein